MSRRVLVHELFIGDCEDPTLYLAQPAHEFMNTTDKGQWLVHQGLEPGYTISTDVARWGFKIYLFADMDVEQWTEWRLRFAS